MSESIKRLFASNGLFRIFVALLLALGALHLFSGIADNMDFNRSITFFIDRPAGFSSLFPAPGSDEAHRLFLTFWHDKWVFKERLFEKPALFTLSSYKIYLFIQSLFVRLLDGPSHEYSFIIGSLLSRVIYFGAFLAMFARMRRTENLLTMWVFMALAGTLALSSEFSAYFNTFFEDQVVIIFLPVLGLLVYRIDRSAQRQRALRWSALALATFIGAAKTAYFPLPLIVAPFVFPLFEGRRGALKSAAALMVCVCITVLPVFSGAFKGVNQYHAVYAGALTVLSPEEIATIDHIGDKPMLRECIKVVAFAPNGPSCVERAHSTYSDVLRLAAMKPVIVPRIIGAMFHAGNEIRIGYLGTTMEHTGNFMTVPVFSWWRDLYVRHVNYAVLGGLVLSLVLIARYRKTERAGRLALLKVSCFLALFGFVGYATSFGDGLADNTRHLIAASYALSLSAVCFVPGVLALLARGSDTARVAEAAPVRQPV
ncbi:hypothetical protein AWB79_03817 [Caballeronia hypogeia]|uniref:Glycosyltransferase RgtA/B/C/D-like domain-containing protein n=1 Tax=Caballeronia hypogeia TaxID=1777140 RepID=A0A158BKB4_9BURK|nr:hypothetical protein [Caballeronia hypogeia]SAK70532.1 hypothetical protein AWB79_03817 [Caballeronia hypogeia]